MGMSDEIQWNRRNVNFPISCSTLFIIVHLLVIWEKASLFQGASIRSAQTSMDLAGIRSPGILT